MMIQVWMMTMMMGIDDVSDDGNNDDDDDEVITTLVCFLVFTSRIAVVAVLSLRVPDPFG